MPVKPRCLLLRVVQEDGRVVGMITATDLLRWIARDLGYVLTG
jgi:CBS domain-containing protein